MIALSTTTYDVSGCLLLATVRLEDGYGAERRGEVVQTLDGGVAAYDGGYTILDRTWSANLKNPTLAQLDTLQYLVGYYPELILCCDLGAFAVRLSFQHSGVRALLTLRPTRRVDA